MSTEWLDAAMAASSKVNKASREARVASPSPDPVEVAMESLESVVSVLENVPLLGTGDEKVE